MFASILNFSDNFINALEKEKLKSRKELLSNFTNSAPSIASALTIDLAKNLNRKALFSTHFSVIPPMT